MSNKILADLLFGALKWHASSVSVPQALIYCRHQYIIMYSIEDRKGRRLPALPIIVFYLLSFALLGRILEKPVLFRHKLNQLLFH